MAEYNGDDVQVYYVDGENGDDTYNGEASVWAGAPSDDGPWQTIQKAFTEIDTTVGGSDGDDVRIMKTSDDATYYALTAELSADWTNKEIIINGANASGVVDGTIVEINGSALAATDSMMKCTNQTLDYSTFTHLKFNAADTAEYCVEFTNTNSHHVNWVNCQFTGATSHGYYTTNAAMYHSFISCRFNDNGGSGLEQQSSTFAMYHKCLFDNNAGDGARIGAFSRISNCVFYNNGDDGLFSNTSGALVCDCVFDNNGSDGVSTTGTSQGIYVNNLYTNNTVKGLNATTTNSEHRQFHPAFYNNGGAYSTPASNNHLSMYNYLTSARVEYDDASNFDFTPDSTSPILGAGVPSPLKWFGSTSEDIGLGKFRAEGGESISIF